MRSLELPQPLLDQSLTSPTSGLLPQGPTSYGPLQGLLPQVSEPLVWHPLGPYPGEVRRSPVLRLSGRWVGSRKWDLKDILPGVQRIFTGLVHRDWDKVLFRRLIGNPVCVCVFEDRDASSSEQLLESRTTPCINMTCSFGWLN